MYASPCPWFLRQVVGSNTFSIITHQLELVIVRHDIMRWGGSVAHTSR